MVKPPFALLMAVGFSNQDYYLVFKKSSHYMPGQRDGHDLALDDHKIDDESHRSTIAMRIDGDYWHKLIVCTYYGRYGE